MTDWTRTFLKVSIGGLAATAAIAAVALGLGSATAVVTVILLTGGLLSPACAAIAADLRDIRESG